MKQTDSTGHEIRIGDTVRFSPLARDDDWIQRWCRVMGFAPKDFTGTVEELLPYDLEGQTVVVKSSWNLRNRFRLAPSDLVVLIVTEQEP